MLPTDIINIIYKYEHHLKLNDVNQDMIETFTNNYHYCEWCYKKIFSHRWYHFNHEYFCQKCCKKYQLV